MKILAINLLKLLIVWAFFAVLIASCTNKTYADYIQKQEETCKAKLAVQFVNYKKEVTL